jgi:hypothetical protein
MKTNNNKGKEMKGRTNLVVVGIPLGRLSGWRSFSAALLFFFHGSRSHFPSQFRAYRYRNLVTDPPSFIGPRGSDPALWFTGLSVSERYSRQRDEGANKPSFFFPSVISVLSLLFIALKADDPEKSHILMYVFT